MGEAGKKPRISVVLPVYNNAGCLQELYQRLKTTLEAAGNEFELLMIEDGGRDNSWAVITELAGQDPRVKAMRLSRNFGQHPAIAAGFEHASGDAIILMDADLQDRPEDIPLLLEKLTSDVDVVYTVKAEHDESFSVRLTSRLYHYVFSKLTRTEVPRNIGTFRAISRKMLEAVCSYPERCILYGPVMFHVGFKCAILPVPRQARKEGSSGYSFRKRLALAVNSILSYTDLPHRLLMITGAIILAASGLYALALVVRYLVASEPLPPGITLLALLVTVSLGIIMFAFGIIGMYVFRVYQEVLHRPRYIVARSINVTGHMRSGQ